MVDPCRMGGVGSLCANFEVVVVKLWWDLNDYVIISITDLTLASTKNPLVALAARM